MTPSTAATAGRGWRSPPCSLFHPWSSARQKSPPVAARTFSGSAAGTQPAVCCSARRGRPQRLPGGALGVAPGRGCCWWRGGVSPAKAALTSHPALVSKAISSFTLWKNTGRNRSGQWPHDFHFLLQKAWPSKPRRNRGTCSSHRQTCHPHPLGRASGPPEVPP